MNFEQAGLGCLALKNFIHVNLCDVIFYENDKAIIYQKKKIMNTDCKKSIRP